MRSAYALIILLLCTYFVIFTRLLISIYGVREWVSDIITNAERVYIYFSTQKDEKKFDKGLCTY